MSTRNRIANLENALAYIGNPIIVWVDAGQSEAEAWSKAFGDQPMPQDDKGVVFVSWDNHGGRA